MFLIYSKGETCSFCTKAKKILEMTGHEYTEMIIGIHILRENFIEMFPEQKTVPLIFHDGQKIGGYEEMVEYLKTVGPGPNLLEG